MQMHHNIFQKERRIKCRIRRQEKNQIRTEINVYKLKEKKEKQS